MLPRLSALRRLLVTLLPLLLVTALQAAAPLKVVSWNLEWFPGHRPTASAEEADKHMELARKALAEINPDIFIGVEIRDWAAFQQLVSAVPGLTAHVVSSFRDPETGEIRPQQIGIASKLACRGCWWEPWKANVPAISRGFSFAALERPGGGLLMVYGNHLKSNRGNGTDEAARDVATMRNEQARQLVAQKEEIEKAFHGQTIAGWLAAGDFNTNHDNQFPLCHVVEIMTAGGFYNTWATVPREQRLTWRSEPGGRFQPTTFDYIFTRGLGEPAAAILETPREISDHYPVVLMLP